MCKLILVHESINNPGTIHKLVTHNVQNHWRTELMWPGCSKRCPKRNRGFRRRNLSETDRTAKINTKYGISQFRLGMRRSQPSQYIHQFTLNGLSDSNLLKIFLLAKGWFMTKNARLSREPNSRRTAKLSTIGQLWPLSREVNFGARDSRFGPN